MNGLGFEIEARGDLRWIVALDDRAAAWGASFCPDGWFPAANGGVACVGLSRGEAAKFVVAGTRAGFGFRGDPVISRSSAPAKRVRRSPTAERLAVIDGVREALRTTPQASTPPSPEVRVWQPAAEVAPLREYELRSLRVRYRADGVAELVRREEVLALFARTVGWLAEEVAEKRADGETFEERVEAEVDGRLSDAQGDHDRELDAKDREIARLKACVSNLEGRLRSLRSLRERRAFGVKRGPCGCAQHAEGSNDFCDLPTAGPDADFCAWHATPCSQCGAASDRADDGTCERHGKRIEEEPTPPPAPSAPTKKRRTR